MYSQREPDKIVSVITIIYKLKAVIVTVKDKNT